MNPEHFQNFKLMIAVKKKVHLEKVVDNRVV